MSYLGRRGVESLRAPRFGSVGIGRLHRPIRLPTFPATFRPPRS